MSANRKNPETRRPRKTEPKFQVQLTAEQKVAKALALENQVVIFTGKPGTSKTLLNCNIALDLLITNRVGKIIVTRPTVGVGKEMGFLPGDAFDFKEGKMAPYTAPILQAMYKLKDKKSIDDMIEKGEIEIVPIQFVRGLNFEDCVVLVDEAQNLMPEELKALTTRLCENGKMMFTCDVNQIDLLNRHSSAGRFFKTISKLEGVVMIELTENFRSKLAIDIYEMIDKEVYQELQEARDKAVA